MKTIRIDDDGHAYRATLDDEGRVSIYRDGIWAGEGRWAPEGRGIEDAAADLPEEVYARLTGLLRSNIAPDLDELGLAMTAQVYEDLDGVYTALPRWGEKTAAVAAQIRASCHERDIVSWDTRQVPHRYLVRRACPAEGRQSFRIVEEEAESEEG